MSKVKSKEKLKSKPKKHSRLSRLQGLMKEYDITVAQLAKSIGRAPSTVSLANNGHNLYDSMDMQNIQKTINTKAADKFQKTEKSKRPEKAVCYSIDEIFFS